MTTMNPTTTNVRQKALDFVKHLQATKGDKAVESFLTDMETSIAKELYTAVMFFLSDEDLDYIDKITDEAVAFKEIKDRFKQRVGISLEEFSHAIKDVIVELYQSQVKT